MITVLLLLYLLKLQEIFWNTAIGITGSNNRIKGNYRKPSAVPCFPA